MNTKSVLRRVRAAWSVLRHEGLFAFARKVRNQVRRGRRLDEAHVAFEVLDAPTGVMIDVGAHHGNSLAPFADEGWRVLAFEPDATNRATLVTQFGDYSGVTIDPRGVSDEGASGVAFFRSDLSTGISGLSAFHESHAQAGTVDITTLATAWSEHGITSVDLLKIDTEGYDLFVLRGVPWDRVRPRMVVCEFEDAKTARLDYAFHDLARYIEERGYRVIVSEWFPIERYGASHTWRRFAPYPCELADPKAWGNLLAVEPVLYDRLFATCSRIAADLDEK